MNEEPPKKKRPDAPAALPPSGRPAMEPGAPPAALAPGERPAFAPSERQALAPSGRQAFSPSEMQSLAPGAAPASLPESGRAALPAGEPPVPDPERELIDSLLGDAKTIAVVGASDKPGKPSHRVAFYLMHAGFEVYPVNPAFKELGGRPAFPDLRSVPAKIDIVDIFRRPEQVLPVVEEAIAVGAKAVWMQEGIVNEEAAARARAAGLQVVMDRCVMKEHRRMKG